MCAPGTPDRWRIRSGTRVFSEFGSFPDETVAPRILDQEASSAVHFLEPQHSVIMLSNESQSVLFGLESKLHLLVPCNAYLWRNSCSGIQPVSTQRSVPELLPGKS
ncbi:hypothetical protein HYQ46_008827 [Verticillium longisporum]|nr:hypothetical protein HYQ46_008827 [Verticillium longisporum]